MEYADSIVELPIVVEGYCNGRAADQLRLSRGRAILVRQYLQTRFQRDPSNLGIVAMKSSPPYGTGRAMSGYLHASLPDDRTADGLKGLPNAI